MNAQVNLRIDDFFFYLKDILFTTKFKAIWNFIEKFPRYKYTREYIFFRNEFLLARSRFKWRPAVYHTIIGCKCARKPTHTPCVSWFFHPLRHMNILSGLYACEFYLRIQWCVWPVRFIFIFLLFPPNDIMKWKREKVSQTWERFPSCRECVRRREILWKTNGATEIDSPCFYMRWYFRNFWTYCCCLKQLLGGWGWSCKNWNCSRHCVVGNKRQRLIRNVFSSCSRYLWV